MRTAFHDLFGAAEDVLHIPDPWGQGITFHLRRIGHPAYQKHLKSQQKKNPLLQLGAQAVFQAQARAMGANAQSANGSDEGKRKSKDWRDFYEKELAKAAEGVKVNLDTFESMADQNAHGIAHFLLEGWEGPILDDDGEELPFSPEKAEELLLDTAWIPAEQDGEEVPYGGQTLGIALQTFLLERSSGHELLRNRMLEDASKNSATSSEPA